MSRDDGVGVGVGCPVIYLQDCTFSVFVNRFCALASSSLSSVSAASRASRAVPVHLLVESASSMTSRRGVKVCSPSSSYTCTHTHTVWVR